MNREIKEAKLSMKLKEVDLNLKLLSLLCERGDVNDILMNDIDNDLDIILDKIEFYKNKCKR